MNDFREMQKAAHQNSANHGFWDKQRNANGNLDPALVKGQVPEKLMLIVSEAAEALDEDRATSNPEDLTKTSYEGRKPCGFPSELADAVIRIMDLAEATGVDLWAAIQEKHAYNVTRPHKHGKQY